MKQAILLLVVALQAIAVHAQSSCKNQHRIFVVPKDKTPKVVTKLGTDPQFAIMCNVQDADQQFNNLKSLAEIPKYRDEINALFQSIGYLGVADPRFTRDKLSAANIPFGAQGMLGDGHHHYEYSLLALPGERMIKGWRVQAMDGCDLYFMSKCGNAFYWANPAEVRDIVTYIPQKTDAKVKVKVYARYDDRQMCQCNDCRGDFETGEVYTALLAEAEADNIPTETEAYPVRAVYVDVDKHTFKKVKMYDVHHKYCDHDCSNACSKNCGQVGIAKHKSSLAAK